MSTSIIDLPVQPAVAGRGMASALRWLRRGALGLVIATIIGILVLPPVWTLVHTSLAASQADLSRGGFTLDHFRALLEGRRLGTAAWNSVVFSLCATFVSLLFGGVLAWLVERTDVPFKGLAYVTTIISLGTPYILYVTAWLFLLGRAGPFNDLYRQWIDADATAFNVNSLGGMVMIEGFLWSPLVFLLLSATFRAANAEMEEAARMSGASIFQTVWRVSIRLAWPAILALALFVFIRNLEAFEVPALVGMPGHVDVLTTEIYRSIKEMPPRLGYASAFSVVMLVIVAVLLFFYGRISKQAERYASITGKGYRPRPFRLGRLRWAASLVILFNFLIVLVLPLAALLWVALQPFMRPMRWASVKFMTTRHFDAVLSSPEYLQLGLNTVIVAVATATLAMLLTIFAGWIAARRQIGGGIIDQLVTVPLVFPGLVLGVALLELSLSLPFPLYGTLGLIILAFLIRYMPYGMRYTYSGVLQIHPELEQAAGVAGAGTGRVLRSVVVPLLWPAVASGWLFIFLICAKEMSLPLLLAGPGSQTISVAMFDLWSNGQGGEVAALGLLWAGLMSLFASAFYLIARRQSAKTFGQ
ncbi:ABC transporter permease [Humitalea sp. 24SJ18S-53]|uniref:ABC transporter permease n=1 Tax=Humitalea sp. 24SJ18S-53 TaxID=3422307 RepID=UPI003D6672A1